MLKLEKMHIFASVMQVTEASELYSSAALSLAPWLYEEEASLNVAPRRASGEDLQKLWLKMFGDPKTDNDTKKAETPK